MDGARHGFAAAPGLAADEDVRGVLRGTMHLLHHLAHGGGDTN